MQHFDAKILDTLASIMSRAEVEELISIFINVVEVQHEILKKDLANNDSAALISIAHGMKGASGNVGALNLASLSLKLETKAGEFQNGALFNSAKIVEILVPISEGIDFIKQHMQKAA